MRTFPMAPIALLVGLTACGGGDGGPSAASHPEPTVRDSAGIRIVENALDGLPLWTVSPDPLLRIGALEGAEAETLYQVNDIDRLSDGSWLVANGSTEEVRVFDADGGYVRTIGRRGEGPGEFVSLSSVFVLPGDTVAVWDARQRRVSVFDVGGAMHRDVSFEALSEGAVTPFGRLDSGRWGVRRSGREIESPGGGISGRSRNMELHAVTEPDGSGPTVFAEIPGSPGWVVASPTFTALRTIPFGAGNAMEVVGDRFVGGLADQPELRLWNARGVEVERWRVLEPPTPLSDEIWEAAREREEEQLADGPADAPAQLLEAYSDFWLEVERPELLPYWGRVRTSSSGDVWLGEYVRRPDEPRRWRVFDASGALVRQVDVPAGFELQWIGEDLMAGVVTDEFDVEYVQVVRLVPPS